jgi:hypothetical protein
MRTGGLLLLQVCLLLLASTTWAYDNDSETNVFTMPAAETEEVAVQWLEGNGFQVYRVEQSYLRVQLQAEKKEARLGFSPRTKTANPLPTP